MSDPYDKLRSAPEVSPPSVDAIRMRAHRMTRRRYLAVASSAVAVVLLAGLGLVLRPDHRSPLQRQAVRSYFLLRRTPVRETF